MNDMCKLLEQKVKLLQSQLSLKDKQIKTLEYRIKNGNMPPVDQTLKPQHVFELEQQHAAQLHVVDLEIENIQLKEKISELKSEIVVTKCL